MVIDMFEVGQVVTLCGKERTHGLATITHVTDSIAVVGDAEYDCRTGHVIPESLYNSRGYYIRLANDEEREQHEYICLRNRLRYHNWETVPLPKLRRIAAILDEPEVEE